MGAECEIQQKLRPYSLTAALILLTTFATAPADQHMQKNLYQRLGGYDAVAAVVDDFFGRMIADPQLGRFFAGLGDDRKRRARQLTVDFICQVAGGPCYYTGRDMKITHTGMGINESDWNKSVEHLVATLDKFKVPATEKDEVLATIGGLRDQIVE
jgi:hemoglobin